MAHYCSYNHLYAKIIFKIGERLVEVRNIDSRRARVLGEGERDERGCERGVLSRLKLFQARGGPPTQGAVLAMRPRSHLQQPRQLVSGLANSCAASRAAWPAPRQVRRGSGHAPTLTPERETLVVVPAKPSSPICPSSFGFLVLSRITFSRPWAQFWIGHHHPFLDHTFRLFAKGSR